MRPARDEKDTIRARIRALRAAVGTPDRDSAARRLAAHLLAHPLVEGRPPGPVLVPVGHRSEIGTDALAARLEERGWTVCRPRSDPEHTHLDAVPYPVEAPLVSGFAGILEPPQDAPSLPPDALRLILVPGVAFARDGHRVGSGMGFFDRFLAPLRQQDAPPVTIGIGYALQLVPEVPHEPHDVPVDGLQMEQQSIVCG